MNIRLFLAVLKRFKWLVIGSIVLAGALGVLTYGMPTLAHGKLTIKRRGQETWQSTAEVLMTQQGFPYGELSAAGQNATGALAGLTPVYAEFVNGDSVQSAIRAQDPHALVSAAQVVDEATGTGLPLLTIASTAPTGNEAVATSRLATQLLKAYVTSQQIAANTAPNDRVQLQIVATGNPPVLTSGHKLTLPMMVFVAVLAAGIALAFVLENLHPVTAERLKGLQARDTADAGRPPTRSTLTEVNGVTRRYSLTPLGDGSGAAQQQAHAQDQLGEGPQDAEAVHGGSS